MPQILEIPATADVADAGRETWDVAVVGAGPAGALAARELARRGARVLLADKSAFPRGKVCGCCLNGRALAALAQVGLGELPTRLGAIPLASARLSAGSRHAEVALPGGMAISRESLDAALVEEAIAAGAVFLPRTQARLATGGEGVRALSLTQGPIQALARSRVLLAADGLAGRLLDGEPDFESRPARGSRVGAATILSDFPANYREGVVYLACGSGGYVGLVRIENNRLDVAAAFDTRAMRRAGGPGPLAEEILRKAGLPSCDELAGAAWHGTPALTRRRCRLAGERLFVLGDAAGYVEPFTGEGMAWALTSAVAVTEPALAGAQSWHSGLADRWEATHRRLVGRRQKTCRAISLILRSPRFATCLLGVLAKATWPADLLLAGMNRTLPVEAMP